MSNGGEASRALAQHLADLRLEDVAPQARDYAADLVLDAIVCALAADHAEDMEPFAAMARASGDQGPYTVIGRAEPTSLVAAAMTNGFRITAVTACDVYAPAEMHSMPAVLPPLLALAERESASGARLLTGVVAGLETVVRLARSFDRTEYKARGWHSPGVLGPFGGAAAAASVLELDAARTADALAIAGSQAAGTWAARGTPTVKFHQARAAFAGATSALLAAEGLSGASQILEADEGGMYVAYASGNPEEVLADWGHAWRLTDISLRLWPGGARVQPTIAAVQQIVQSQGIGWDDVERVAIHVAPAIARDQAWAARPTSTFAALASIHFTAALTFRYGTAAPGRFVESGYQDPELGEFIESRLEVVPDEAVPPLGSRVLVTTKTGRSSEASVDVPRGNPRSRATRDELAAKAHLFADDRIGADAVDELIGLVRGIAAEPTLDRLLSILRRDAHTLR